MSPIPHAYPNKIDQHRGFYTVTALQLQTPLRGSSPLSAAVVSCSAGGKPELTPAQNKKSNDIPTASFTSLYIDLHCMIYHGWWGTLDFVCRVSHQQHPVSASPLLQISYGALELFGLEVLGQPAEIPKITFWLVVIVNGYSLPIMAIVIIVWWWIVGG